MANTQTNQTTNVQNLTKVQVTKLQGLPSTSAKIRYLHSLGWNRSTIAKYLGKRYQHIRNVLITPLTGERK